MSDVSVSTNTKELVSTVFANLIATFDHHADDVRLQCAEAAIEGKLERSGTLLDESKMMQEFRHEVEMLSTRWSKGLLRLPKAIPSKKPSARKDRSRSVSKTPSPKPGDWLVNVPELSALPHTASWKDICDHLGINVASDSARRRLKSWVQDSGKNWPNIPEPS